MSLVGEGLTRTEEAGGSNPGIGPTGHGPQKLGYIGSVADVLRGIVSPVLSIRKFLAAEFDFGFELASPRDHHSLGESVIVNGVCYATSTDNSSPEYGHTIFGREFQTGGMFIIPQATKPSHLLTFRADGYTCTLNDLYTTLFDAVKQPFALVGLMDCVAFHGTAIGKPPIDGQAIFEHKAEYFPNPDVQLSNVTAFVIGVVTDYRDQGLSHINKQLEVVLYKNPLETDSVLSTHAHALTLKQPVKRLEDITPEQVDKSLHLFAAGTVLRSLHADLYTISSLVDYQ